MTIMAGARLLQHKLQQHRCSFQRLLSSSTSSTTRPPAALGVTPHTVIPFMASQWPDNPYENFQRLVLHELSGNHSLISQKIASSDIRPGGFISGPSQFCMADVGMWITVFGARGFDEMAMTSEMSIRYVRPAVGDTLWCQVDVVSAGQRNIVMNAKQWTENVDKPTSVAQGSYVMPKKSSTL